MDSTIGIQQYILLYCIQTSNCYMCYVQCFHIWQCINKSIPIHDSHDVYDHIYLVPIIYNSPLGVIIATQLQTWQLRTTLNFLWNLTIHLANLHMKDTESHVLMIIDQRWNVTLLCETGLLENISFTSIRHLALISLCLETKIFSKQCEFRTGYRKKKCPNNKVPYLHVSFQVAPKHDITSNDTNCLMMIIRKCIHVLHQPNKHTNIPFLMKETFYKALELQLEVGIKKDIGSTCQSGIYFTYCANNVFLLMPCKHVGFYFSKVGNDPRYYGVWQIFGHVSVFIDIRFLFIDLPLSDKKCTMCVIETKILYPKKYIYGKYCGQAENEKHILESHTGEVTISSRYVVSVLLCVQFTYHFIFALTRRTTSHLTDNILALNIRPQYSTTLIFPMCRIHEWIMKTHFVYIIETNVVYNYFSQFSLTFEVFEKPKSAMRLDSIILNVLKQNRKMSYQNHIISRGHILRIILKYTMLTQYEMLAIFHKHLGKSTMH